MSSIHTHAILFSSCAVILAASAAGCTTKPTIDCGGAGGGTHTTTAATSSGSSGSTGSGGGTTCQAPLAECQGACVDTATDPAHCGGCDVACPAGAACSGGQCVAPTCNDGVKNQGESDVDCGGSCPACGLGEACGASTDCASAGCCSSVCVDLGTDPSNCGGCGVACTAGANANATCAMGACTVTCAMGFRDCDGDPANGCETNGSCQPMLLANQGGADGITVDDTNIYWAVRYPGTIYTAPKAGGPVTALYTGESGVVGITHDDTNLYWTIYGDLGGHTVRSGPKAGGQPPSLLATIGGSPLAIDLYQGDVYFTDFLGDTLYKVPALGGQTTVVAQGLPGRNGGLLVDGTGFFGSSANINTLYYRPFGGQATTLAGGFAYPLQIARDASYFYVSAYSSPALYRVPIGGGAAQPVVQCNGCEGVAVDDKFVYYTNLNTGDVYRIAK